VTQRVQDAERFVAELGRPLPGERVGAAVSESELQQDGESFMAFASVFGVKPPSPQVEEATA
jgi:hypothetical protein